MTNPVVSTEIVKHELPKPIEISMETFSARAMAMQIVDKETFIEANEIFLMHHELIKNIKEFFAPLKARTHAAHKAVTEAEREQLDKLSPVKNELQKKIDAYKAEQERIRAEEIERSRREAQAKAEEDRLKVAIQAEKEGRHEEAREIVEAPLNVPPVAVAPAVPTIAGVGSTTNWKFVVDDLRELVKAVYLGQVPLMAIQPNEVFLRQQARALKGTVTYPGVRFYSESTTKATGKK